MLAVCGLSNLLCSLLAPGEPALLALGSSLGFLLGGLGMYLGFARTEGVTVPVGHLVRGTVASLVMGAGVYMAYLYFVAATASKLMLVVKCVALGALGMVLYLLLMGPLVPTREILGKLRGVRK